MPLLRHAPECLSAAQGEWPASGAWVRESAPGFSGRREPVAAAALPGRRPRAIRIFANPVVEHVFAKAHPITPIVWFGPFIAYGLVHGVLSVGALRTAEVFLLGWLVWTLIEYVLHRFLFHMRAGTPGARLRSFLLHGYHHEFPTDRMRLVAPPLLSWPLAAIVIVLYVSAFGRDAGLALFAGTATGYIAYDWIHYYTHHFRPRNPVGRFLRRYHMLHHFDDENPNRRFGVSSPLWDFVFGTFLPTERRRDRPGSGATDPDRPVAGV